MKKHYFFILFFILLTSCVRHKQLVHLQNEDSSENTNNFNNYNLRKGDILNIRVYSVDEKSLAIFNREAGVNPLRQLNEASLYIAGYEIDDEGEITLPIIGKIKIEAKTLSEAKTLIFNEMSKYYKLFTLEVKLVNFKVTIIGEVEKPGTVVIYNPKINIYQVLGYVGGLTDYANLKEVKVFNENDPSKFNIVNLENENIVGSENYFLKPNDVIYIKPLKSKAFKINAQVFQISVSILTSVLVLINILQ